jgi:alkanesulfonate monooxygenase SsuD/methylene tetrahydromethanopterin reductase-like flavin-dependent oxidoreductase (luciferase family)
MWTSVQALVMLSDDAAAVEGALASPFGARMIAGNAAQLIEQMERYAALGFDEFIVPDFNLGATPEARRANLERIDEQVVSQLA